MGFPETLMKSIGRLYLQGCDHFDRHISGVGLSVFRVGLGAAVAWEALYLWRIDFATVFLARPSLLFPYAGLEWLTPPSAGGTNVLIATLLVSALAFALGRVSRLSAAACAGALLTLLCFDRSIYNNHLYLMILLLAMFAWLPNKLSTRPLAAGAQSRLRAWQLTLFRVQVCIVYFFGAITKLTLDWWVRHEPPLSILASAAERLDTPWLLHSVPLWGLIVGGPVVDLLVGVGLLVPRWRVFAIALNLPFHIANAIIFDDISVFPYLMIWTNVLFIPSTWWRKMGLWRPPSSSRPLRPTTPVVWSALGLWVFLQMAIPLRHYLIPGNVDWTAEGLRFSWRMKAQSRSIEQVHFVIEDYDLKRRVPVGLEVLTSFGLHGDQIRLVASDPAATARLARFLADDYRQRTGSQRVEVRAKVLVGLNGRPAQDLVDPNLDLSAVEPSMFAHDPWIEPLQ